MSGIQTLQARSNNNDLISRAFIEKTLKNNIQSWRKAQDRALASAPDGPKIDLVKYSRNFAVSGDTLTHKHNIQQRFIDMRRTRYGKQKPVQIHNSTLYKTFNNILFELRFGLTNAVRAQIAKEQNIELYG